MSQINRASIETNFYLCQLASKQVWNNQCEMVEFIDIQRIDLNEGYPSIKITGVFLNTNEVEISIYKDPPTDEQAILYGESATVKSRLKIFMLTDKVLNSVVIQLSDIIINKANNN